MTFVPQPYEQFVDDLLTALTGGVAREEHRFVGGDESYSLALPGAISGSLRVFGQSGETFVRFDRGIDYDFVADDGALRWRDNAKRRPDDRSVFYVNYYREEGDSRLSDRNPGSVTTTLAESIARELAVLHQQMRRIYESAFVDLATGTALDQVAALLALTRKDARFASGEVHFTRGTPAPGDITIPAGSVVSTDRGETFEATDKRTLRRGQLSLVAPIRAQVEGTPGRVDPGTIKNINRPIFGIDAVTNEAATFFATERESDEEFRRRIRGVIERAGKSTVESIRLALIEGVPGVTDANVHVVERPEMPGVVEVKLGLGAADTKTVQSIEEAIFAARPAGVRVTHNLAGAAASPNGSAAAAASAPTASPTTATSSTPTGPLAPALVRSATRAATRLPPEVLERAPSGILPLRAAVLLRLAQPALGVSQKEAISDGARGRVVEFIEALPMGADLVHSKLLARIVADEEVADAIVEVGPAEPPSEPLHAANLATDGRKTKIATTDVAVRLMEETVYVDVLVTLEPRKPKPGERPESGSDGAAKLSPQYRRAVEDAVARVLAAARGTVERSEVQREIGTALGADHQSVVQLVAVAMNAEYEETGRLLNNTEAVTLELQQVPVRREVRVEMPGVLGG